MTPSEWAHLAAALLIATALVLTGWRLTRGPTLADRVVGFDMLSYLGIATALLTGVAVEAAVYVDVAITLALLAFLGTVALARTLETRTG